MIRDKELIQFEIDNIIAWIYGYVSVLEGHERLHEEVDKLFHLNKIRLKNDRTI